VYTKKEVKYLLLNNPGGTSNNSNCTVSTTDTSIILNSKTS